MTACNNRRQSLGFSLIEVMVSSVILIMILGIVVSMTNYASHGVQYSAAKIESFQSARFAFETMTRAVSSATLNNYYDYFDVSRNRRTPTNASTFNPDVYGRYSELEFVSGKNLVATPRAQVTHAIFFQTPLDYTVPTSGYSHLQGLLNVLGFYVEFYNDSDSRPSFVSSPERWRYRLMELLQPTENFSVYDVAGHSWFTASIDPGKTTSPPVRLLAENIIACVICPRLSTDTTDVSSLAADYEYDSNIANAASPISWTSGSQPSCMNQLPPLVRIVLVAVDERSMIRLQGNSTTPPDLGFDYSKIFKFASKLDEDLATLGQALAKKNVSFRVFQTDVAIRGAKWSP